MQDLRTVVEPRLDPLPSIGPEVEEPVWDRPVVGFRIPTTVYICGSCGHDYGVYVLEACPECGYCRGVWDIKRWPDYCRTNYIRQRIEELRGMTEVTLLYGSTSPLQQNASPDARVPLEKFQKVSTEETQTLDDLEKEGDAAVRAAADHELTPDELREAVDKYVNDKLLERIQLLEELSQVTKIKWITDWRRLEERIAKASESERARVRAADKTYRAKKTTDNGEDKEKKPRLAKPKDKREGAIQLLMTLGYSREEAEAKADAAPGVKKKEDE